MFEQLFIYSVIAKYNESKIKNMNLIGKDNGTARYKQSGYNPVISWRPDKYGGTILASQLSFGVLRQVQNSYDKYGDNRKR